MDGHHGTSGLGSGMSGGRGGDGYAGGPESDGLRGVDATEGSDVIVMKPEGQVVSRA